MVKVLSSIVHVRVASVFFNAFAFTFSLSRPWRSSLRDSQSCQMGAKSGGGCVSSRFHPIVLDWSMLSSL
jgi:hypothetical protein